jgi:cell division protein FtsI (penicillin-binding protein 3)
MQQNRTSLQTNFSRQAARRLVLVWGLLSLTGLALTMRLIHLQGMIGAEMKKKARQQQTVLMKPYVLRRKIIDRNGTVMALDRPAYMLYAYPNLIPAELKNNLSKRLSEILGQPESKLRSLLQLQNTQKIDYWLTEEVADRVRSLVSELKAPGIELVQQRHRLYPQKDLAAEVLGFVDAQDKGQAGIEQSQEDLLLAQPAINY